MKNLSIFSSKLFLFIDTSLKIARQNVYSSIALVLLIINLKMIFGKLFGLFDFSRTQFFYIYKSTKVIIVC